MINSTSQVLQDRHPPDNMFVMNAKSEKVSRTSTLLISCYELGHQPAGLATALGFLKRAGIEAETMDVSVEGFDKSLVSCARFIGISVPMHTALRLGMRIAKEARKLNPGCHICFYGLYAVLNAEFLLNTIADSVIGGESEEALVKLVSAVHSEANINIDEVSTRNRLSQPVLKRLDFAAPHRERLVPLEHYAKLAYLDEERLAGYVEASRGCLHMCTHCPIPPVYGGRFFVVPREIVLDDIRHFVQAGARHITFGDPDFLNGPGHSLKIARDMHQMFPGLTFDFTAKVEHLIKYRDLLGEFAEAGCLFVVSAVESLSDRVLSELRKGHTREDVFEALRILREAGIEMRPTFVPFSPWATLDDYVELLDFVESRDLVDHVDPVQFSIRLLIPPGSLLATLNSTKPWLRELNQESLSYEWKHDDHRMDELQLEVAEIVERAALEMEDPLATFRSIKRLAYEMRDDGDALLDGKPFEPLRLRPPRLTEAWFC